jgi:hypothetical protein
LQAATWLQPDAAETLLARAQYLYYGLRDYAGVRGDPRFEKIVLTVLNFSGNSRLPSSSVSARRNAVLRRRFLG